MNQQQHSSIITVSERLKDENVALAQLSDVIEIASRSLLQASMDDSFDLLALRHEIQESCSSLGVSAKLLSLMAEGAGDSADLLENALPIREVKVA